MLNIYNEVNNQYELFPFWKTFYVFTSPLYKALPRHLTFVGAIYG